MTGRRRWRVRLSAAAEADFRDILRWTARQFGEAQAGVYHDVLASAIAALADGPDAPGARERDEIASGLMTLHVARGKRRGRHLILFRALTAREPPVIDVLRLLHDAMDLTRHVDPVADEDQ
ncbi:MAG: type II toxin-antitoxin system RelE/ParE family toxin [Acidobacteriota bacterium]|nr:type II toxin-antitoxin system RelE/ParE family toxin [Acidobacteriota bacterium]